jgi:MFS family permease
MTLDLSKPSAGLQSALARWLVGVFINRNYALFMAGSFVSATGSWFQAVAVGWLVLELSNSAFILGLTNFAQMAPLLVLGSLGGALADRVERRTLVLVSQAGGTLALGALALLAATGHVAVPLILLTSLALGLCNAVLWPTWSVFIKDLVGPDRLREAIALNSARFNLTRVIGPALAGVVLSRFGAAACLELATAGMLGVLVSVWLIRLPPGERRQPAPWLQALREGLAFAWHHGPTRRLLLITGWVGLVALPYQAFLPAIARDALAAGPDAYGILLTAVGAGAIAGALLSGARVVAHHPERAMAILAAGTGLGLILFAASRSLWVAVPALALVGLCSIGYLATANATLQLAVPDALVGRVMGLWVMVNAGTTPVGSLLEGALAERIGLTTTLVLAGGACTVLGLGLGGSMVAHRLEERPLLPQRNQ